MVLCEAIFVLCVFTIFILIHYKKRFNYWKELNVPYPPPKFPQGNIRLLKEYVGTDIAEIYKEMKKNGYKFAGIFLWDTPCFIPINLNLIKNILNKDFEYFTDHGSYVHGNDPFSTHLFAKKGADWKDLRMRLTPAFTTGKIKRIVDIIENCGEPYLEELNKNCIGVNIRELISRYMTDVIGSAAFGIECNSFAEPNAEFWKYGKMFQDTRMNIGFFITMIFPKITRCLNIKAINTEMRKFFSKVVKDTVEFRTKNGIRRSDFMQILLDLKNDDNQNGSFFSTQEIAAQVFIFFIAGYESSTITIMYTLYELSRNSEIQERVREEINKFSNGKISYDDVNEMKYLDQVVHETLRKYTPGSIIFRECTKPYKVPDTDIIIEKGTKVFIPVYGIHNDPEYFKNPENYDPERFSDNKRNIEGFYPFGSGPRTCIAQRLGLIIIKVALIMTLRRFKVQLNPKTRNHIRYEPNSMTLRNKDLIYLDLERIKK